MKMDLKMNRNCPKMDLNWASYASKVNLKLTWNGHKMDQNIFSSTVEMRSSEQRIFMTFGRCFGKQKEQKLDTHAIRNAWHLTFISKEKLCESKPWNWRQHENLFASFIWQIETNVLFSSLPLVAPPYISLSSFCGVNHFSQTSSRQIHELFWFLKKYKEHEVIKLVKIGAKMTKFSNFIKRRKIWKKSVQI